MLYNLWTENFATRQCGFLYAISTLTENFPPALYPTVWCSTHGAHEQIKINMLGLLLEISESSCASLNELTLILKIISALFAGNKKILN